MKRGLQIALASMAVCGAARAEDPSNVRPLPQGDANMVVRTADPKLRGLSRADFPRIYKLNDHVYIYENLQPIGDLEVNFTTNAMFVVTSDGVVVADAMADDAETQKMIGYIRKITDKPIKYVVVGADHQDHTGGNAMFPASAAVISSQTSYDHMKGFNTRRAKPLPLPTIVVRDRYDITLGGVTMQVLNLGRAHTGGDLEVYFPDTKIMYTSEVVFNRIYPSTYSSYPSEWIATLKRLEAYDASVYIPNHGFIDSPQVLKEEMINLRRSLENLVEESTRFFKQGVAIEQVPRRIQLGEFAYWTRAANNLPDGISRVYQELRGELPPPPALPCPDHWCKVAPAGR
jgi:glyoxylase-like metal-dependent hydrolase (beta-lactamase superfamily II)